MNRAQKIAWFNLVVVSLAFGLSVAAFVAGCFIFRVSTHQAASGFGFIGIMGLLGLTPFLFKKDRSKVQFDERDLAIIRKAAVVSYSVFWILFVAAAMVPWFIIGPDGKITVNYLPWMVFGGWGIVMLLRAIVILNEYGWSGKGENHESN
jgi:hypothetical protein